MATFDKFRSVYTHDELMERLRGSVSVGRKI